MITTGIVVLFCLLAIALIDLYTNTVPSIITTTLLLILVIIIGTLDISAIPFGIAGGLLGLAFYEINFFRGLADIKVLSILGLCAGTFNNFVWMTLMLGICSIGVALVRGTNKQKEIPFVPVLFMVYMLMLLGGFVIV